MDCDVSTRGCRGGIFFSGDTLSELAANIKNKYQRKPMAASALEKTVANYNSYVDGGKDPDFGKPAPKYKIQTPPFYAAWSRRSSTIRAPDSG